MIMRTLAAWKTEAKMEPLTGIKWPCVGGHRWLSPCMPAPVEVAAAVIVTSWER